MADLCSGESVFETSHQSRNLGNIGVTPKISAEWRSWHASGSKQNMKEIVPESMTRILPRRLGASSIQPPFDLLAGTRAKIVAATDAHSMTKCHTLAGGNLRFLGD